MNYPWMKEYCLSKPYAILEYKTEWEVNRFLVGDKMFAMEGEDNQGRHILTLKLEVDYGQLLRSQYEDIRPGYYMNKTHWNSLDLASAQVPDEILKDMIDRSYALIFGSLPKKVKAELEAKTP